MYKINQKKKISRDGNKNENERLVQQKMNEEGNKENEKGSKEEDKLEERDKIGEN